MWFGLCVCVCVRGLVILRLFCCFLLELLYWQQFSPGFQPLLLPARPSHTFCRVLSKQTASRHTSTLTHQHAQTNTHASVLQTKLSAALPGLGAEFSSQVTSSAKHSFATFPLRVCVFVLCLCVLVCVCLFTAVLRLFVSSPCCP